MRIAELWRYPVKSMGGGRVDAVTVERRGVHADRLWAVRDLDLGAVTTARRLPMLLGCTARFFGEPRADAGPGRATDVVVTFPDGVQLRSDEPAIHARLSALTKKNVQLVPLPPRGDRAAYRGVFANQADLRRQFDIPDGEPLPDLSMLPVRRLAELGVVRGGRLAVGDELRFEPPEDPSPVTVAVDRLAPGCAAASCGRPTRRCRRADDTTSGRRARARRRGPGHSPQSVTVRVRDPPWSRCSQR